MTFEGKPTDSLELRDADLARLIVKMIDQPEIVRNMSGTEVRGVVRFCYRRLQRFRMGGRSAPLIGLCVILWNAKATHLDFLVRDVETERLDLDLDLDAALNTALGIAMDPSYIWPEWGVVLAGVIAWRCFRLLPEDSEKRRATKDELTAQLRLRLVHLKDGRPPTAAGSVQRAAEAVLDEWTKQFPSGMQPVVEACSKPWPDSALAGKTSESLLQARIDDLDKIMPAWYTAEDRAVYRSSMERRDAWIVSKVHLT